LGNNKSCPNGMFIYHPDQNFKGVLNIQSEIWNSTCGSTYGYIGVLCFSHITGKNDLHQSGWSIYHPYSIFKEIMNLNLKIWNSTSGSTYGYIALWSLLGKIQSSPIRMFYTSSSWEFQEGSEYPARNFKFSLWQQIWLHLYNVFQSHSHITGKFDSSNQGDLYIILT